MGKPLPIRAVIEGAEPFHTPEGEATRLGRRKQGKYNCPKLNEEFALVLMGSKAIVLQEQPSASLEDRIRYLKIEAFKAWLMNTVTYIKQKDGKQKPMSWAERWLIDPDRRQYRGIEFYPDPENKDGTDEYYNLWKGFEVKARPRPGAYPTFFEHLFVNLCLENAELFDWVFGWFAHIVQRPRERVGTSLAIRGAMGSGKTKIGEVFGSLIAQHYFLVDQPHYVTGKFNNHMASCLLLQADEGFWAGDKQAEGRIKGLVTSAFQMIEPKGLDAIRIRNYLRLLITANEDWVVPAGKDERRFAVIDMDPRRAQDIPFFARIDEEMNNGGREALLHDLLTFDLSKVNLRHIPKTEALFEQKVRSLDAQDSWWLERLREGTQLPGTGEWHDWVPTERLRGSFGAAADRTGVRRRPDETSFGMRLRKLVPGVKRTKAETIVDEGSGFPRKERVYGYQFPTLIMCRQAFEKSVGQVINWDDDG